MKKKTEAKSHFNLALVIGAIISFLLIALGTAITLYTYQNQMGKAFKDTEKIFDASSRQTEERLQVLIDSVTSFVSVSSALENLDLGGEENFNLLLAYFQLSFKNIPWMDSFYVGYEDGSFSMIQAVRNKESVRAAFSATEQTAYIVKTITNGKDGKKHVCFQFYDTDLLLLESRDTEFDQYDPRTRPWYVEAIQTDESVISSPYLFFTTKKIGITVAHSLKNGKGVVGADSVLESLANLLQEQRLTPSTEILLSSKKGSILFCSSEKVIEQLQQNRHEDENKELFVREIENQLAAVLYTEFIDKGIEGCQIITVDGRKWFGHVRNLDRNKNSDIFILTGAPVDELMVDARTIRQRNLLIMLSAIFIAVAFGIYFSRRIAGSLHNLSVQAESIRDFKLGNTFAVQSRIAEVDELANTMTVMQSAISRFVEIARALSAEKDMDQVLEMIVSEAQSITGADGGAIGLVSDDEKSFSYVLVRNDKSDVHFGGTSGDVVPLAAILLDKETDQTASLERLVIQSGQTRAITGSSDAAYELGANTCELHQTEGYHCSSLLMIPLLNRQKEVIGILHLVNARDSASGDIIAFPEHKISYVQALSSNAALALDNNRLIRAQKELFDSFVRLIAGAIDTKSPYTGGHCQRVPIIAGLLADAASLSEEKALKEFYLSEDEKYELFVASWLHDCGKVTTPEYVVDKATKLETIYNRIHEIRTRFEVLWRDVDIAYYKALADTPGEKEALQQERERQQQKLQKDFSFIAATNVGGEFMSPDKVERLQEIGKQLWQRNFDDRIGLSGDESARRDLSKAETFPVTETLLADKQDHIFQRLDGGNPYGDNPWKIVMPVPEFNYNQGELYNLSIAKGTLTEEERYKINDHIVQTIEMLNKLPFPKEIRRVPNWAGNHHEKLDGTGYPRSLKAEQLSIPERIMAVADIFEALTAADRPYNVPKSLSKCIQIMSFMRNDGHICPDLFALLLSSGIYKEYAKKYMKPEQIDEVDVASYLQ